MKNYNVKISIDVIRRESLIKKISANSIEEAQVNYKKEFEEIMNSWVDEDVKFDLVSIEAEEDLEIQAETNFKIVDDFIIRVESLGEAIDVVEKLELLGYKKHAPVEKYCCYYVGSRIESDDDRNDNKYVQWGRDEVKESKNFDNVMSYSEFMKLNTELKKAE